VRRKIQLVFLAPRIVEAIADGRQPVDLTVEALTRRIELPLVWRAQHEALRIE
jgi:site-specific DNA recombinase